MNDLERITSGFSLLPMVEAVALSGSRTCMINDGDSDYDIYVYSSGPVPPERREKILSGIFPSVSISCSPFEEGDEAAGEDGSVYDLMYSATLPASYTTSAHRRYSSTGTGGSPRCRRKRTETIPRH